MLTVTVAFIRDKARNRRATVKTDDEEASGRRAAVEPANGAIGPRKLESLSGSKRTARLWRRPVITDAYTAPRRAHVPLVLVSVAFFLVAFGLVSGTLRLGAALAMLLVAIAVLVDNPVLGWRGLVTGLLLIILFIPIRRYVLPGGMPFQLEPYRLYVMLLVGGWVLSLFVDPVSVRRDRFRNAAALPPR